MNCIISDYFNQKQRYDLERILQYANREIDRTIGKENALRILYHGREDLLSHSESVAAIAAFLGLEFRLPLHEVVELAIGGYLHDVGKVKIPTAILDKPDNLTEEEYLFIQYHPVIGRKCLKPYHFSKAVMDMVFFHHERLDGEGYPLGISELPISVQFITLADIFDAVCAKRCYHEGEDIRTSLSILSEEHGINQMAVDLLHDSLCANEKVSEFFY